jgi:hypothetical protein
MLSPCVTLKESVTDFRAILRAGEVALVLDPELPSPGRTMEYRAGATRSFLVAVNPSTVNFATMLHEIGGHLLHGHSAISVPDWLVAPTNIILDVMILPAELDATVGLVWRIAVTLLLAAFVFTVSAAAWRRWRQP